MSYDYKYFDLIIVKGSGWAHINASPLIYAAFRSKAKGLFLHSDECRRRGLENPLIRWNIAPSAWPIVLQQLRQISPALMDLKNVSTIAA